MIRDAIFFGVAILLVGVTAWAVIADVERRRLRSINRRLTIDHGQIARAVINARDILRRVAEGAALPNAIRDALGELDRITPEVEGTLSQCGCGHPWTPGEEWCPACGSKRLSARGLGPSSASM
jgi:hypothetical protein